MTPFDPIIPLMPDLRIRIANAQDVLCISGLGIQVFLDTYATQGLRDSLAREAFEHLSADAVSASLAQPGTTFLVAEAAAHIVGFAQVQRGPTHALAGPGEAAELVRLYVQERFCGQGIGRALLREAESLAQSQGAAMLWLTAWSGNQRARDFYAHQGYRDAGATHYVFGGEAYDNRLFIRPLDAHGTGLAPR